MEAREEESEHRVGAALAAVQAAAEAQAAAVQAAADAQAVAVLAAADAQAAAVLAAAEQAAAGVEAGNQEAVGNICSVCALPWTGNGAHRICCIPCGHVFGRSCLETSLEGHMTAPCPICNQPFGLHNIVTLFASANLHEGCCNVKDLKARMLQHFGRAMVKYRAEHDAELQRQEEILRTQLEKEKRELFERVMSEVDEMLSRKK